MNVFAKFDEIPQMLLQDIKETKRYGHTFVRSFVQTDNVKTVYPPTNTVCWGYNNHCGMYVDHIKHCDEEEQLLGIVTSYSKSRLKMTTGCTMDRPA